MFSIVNGSFTLIDKDSIGSKTVPGTQHARLQVPASELSENKADAFTLLDWKAGLHRFRGRTDVLRELTDWATGSEIVSIKIVSGEGGVGKSTLAGRLALDLKKCNWEAGFVDPALSETYETAREGTLVIVDDTEERLTAVERFLEGLAGAQGGRLARECKRWRLLLLSRWDDEAWEPVFERIGTPRYLMDVPVRLGPPNDDELYEIFDAAHEQANLLLKAEAASVEKGAFLDWVGKAEENRLPLFAAAAAVHGVTGSIGDLEDGEPAGRRPLGGRGRELIEALARRELLRLERLSDPVGEETIPLLLAHAILADGLRLDRIEKLIELDLPPSIDDLARVIRLLSELGYWRDNAVAPLRPNLLAAAFAILTLRRAAAGYTALPVAVLSSRLLEVTDRSGLAPMERVMHDSETVLEMADGGRRGMSAWLEELVDSMIENEEGILFLRHLDAFSSRRSTWGFSDAMFKAREQLANAAEDEHEKSAYLYNLSNDYADAGRRAESLAAIQRAAEICNVLASDDPAGNEFDFAMCFARLSDRLKDAGRQAEALDAIGRAVAILRELAAESPAQYGSDLASWLDKMSLDLSEAGRNLDALAAAEEAIGIRRRLVADDGIDHAPDMATSLHNLSQLFEDDDRYAEALAAIDEAIGIWRRFSKQAPLQNEPDLAGSLDYRAKYLAKLGRGADAIAAMEEAVRLYRRLAADASPDYAVQLAECLMVLTVFRQNMGDDGKAFATVRDGIEALSARFIAMPKRYEQLMTMLVGTYLEIAAALGAAPDDDVLDPIGPTLHTLSRENSTRDDEGGG